MIVSGTMGEGHNAAGRAIAEAIGRLWPGCDVRWVDTCEVMGPGAGPLWRAIYVVNIQKTPWLYEFVYRSYWQQPWFADLSKRFIGSWAGRPMAKLLRSYQPDLIVSTFPFGSSGLSWLRRHRGLDAPVGAWVPDFCPHPFWVFRNLDLHYVVHDRAVPVALASDPGARVAVAKPPVRQTFIPRDRDVTRKEFGLPTEQFVALVSAGSYGFGGVEACVSTLLDADPNVHVVVACGHNKRLLKELTSRVGYDGRLTALGWVDDMPLRIAAADIVVGNAGGATALEALACGRPLLMFDPIAAHGRANADLMAKAGVALLCLTSADLRVAVRELIHEPQKLESLRHRAMDAAVTDTATEDELLALAAYRGRTRQGPVPLRAEDTMLHHAHAPARDQQVGAVLVLAPSPLRVADLRTAVRERVTAAPELVRRLDPARVRWLRSCWLVDADVDLDNRVRQVVLGADGVPASLDELVAEFFSVPCDPYRMPWEMLFVRGVDGDRAAVVVKAHRMLGSGQAIVAALTRLFDPPPNADGGATSGEPYHRPLGDDESLADAGPLACNESGAHNGSTADTGTAATAAANRSADPGVGKGVTARRYDGFWGLPPSAPRVGTPRGLGRMAAAALAPTGGRRTAPTGGRRYLPVTLPAGAVADTARALHVEVGELLLAVLAESLTIAIRDGDGATTDRRAQRVVVAWHVPATGRYRPGGLPVSVTVDLPVGPMPARQRLEVVRRQLAARRRRGEAEAEALAMRTVNLLPAPLQRATASRIARQRFSFPLVSILPRITGHTCFAGAPVERFHPVPALPDGVGLGVAVMAWHDSISIGILADTALVRDTDAFASCVRDACDGFEAVASRTGEA